MAYEKGCALSCGLGGDENKDENKDENEQKLFSTSEVFSACFDAGWDNAAAVPTHGAEFDRMSKDLDCVPRGTGINPTGQEMAVFCCKSQPSNVRSWGDWQQKHGAVSAGISRSLLPNRYGTGAESQFVVQEQAEEALPPEQEVFVASSSGQGQQSQTGKPFYAHPVFLIGAGGLIVWLLTR